MDLIHAETHENSNTRSGSDGDLSQSVQGVPDHCRRQRRGVRAPSRDAHAPKGAECRELSLESWPRARPCFTGILGVVGGARKHSWAH